MRSSIANSQIARPRFLSVIECLEWRVLLSAFYDYDVLASTGDSVGSGFTIASFTGETSINDSGRVAFVANAGGAGTGRMIVSGDTQTAPRIISFNPSTRNYDFAQITNDNLVVSADRFTTSYFVRTWDSNSPGSFTTLARNTDKDDTNTTLDIVQIPSRANAGPVSFFAFPGGNGTLEYRSPAGAIRSVGAITGVFRSMTGDNGWTVVKTSPASGQAILAFPATGTGQSIATPAGFSALGLPGISDDGTIIAFAGDSRVDGTGIFLSHLDAGVWSTPIKVAGINNELGYDTLGNGLFLKDFDMSIASRVGVVRQEGGVPGFEGDTILLSFIGTPSAASRDNPQLPGTPLLFSKNQGLWTLRIVPSKPLSGAGALQFNRRTSPIPVMQIGDMIGGQAVTAISTYDSIATATKDQDGAARATVAPGDHYVVFRATTAAGDKIVRAAQFDSDSDGLFDHWERAPGARPTGIDIDRDGIPDLNLNAMGAQTNHKDLFLETDWLKPDAATHRNFSPQPEAISFFVNMFANSPLSNPDGTTGVIVHVDAGAGLSQNMGGGSLQGGDLISQPGTGAHVHVVYYGLDGSVTFPTAHDALGRPIVTRSLENIKKNLFGTTTKDARELAFRYAVFADFYEGTVNGANLFLPNYSTGSAESPYFDATADPANPGHLIDYRSIPGNDLILSFGGARGTANHRLNVPGGGPPASVPEPVGFLQGQTLAHEFGHTLSLLHGGFDMDTVPAVSKPTYRSLMNYSYQLDPDTAGVLVRDYSRAGDPIFNDWANVELGFSTYFDGVGNSLNKDSRAGVSDTTPFEPGSFTLEDYAALNGSLDDQTPTLAINTPADSASVPGGSALTVMLTAADNVAVASVTVSFDADGDGSISPAETVTASNTGGDNYQAVFSNVAGASGARTLTATVTDTSTFSTSQTLNLNVTNGAAPPPKVTASSFTFETAPVRLTFTFDQDVSASLAASDFFIRKTNGTGQIVPTLLPYDSVNNRVTLTLPGVPADGRYIVTLSSTGITNGSGGQLDGDGNGTQGPNFDFNFFFITGDANHDGAVDFLDLAKLAQSYNIADGQRTYSTGDFNYDGNTDFLDLAMLAQRYNTALPAAPVAAPLTAAPSAMASLLSSSAADTLPATFSRKRITISKPKPPSLPLPARRPQHFRD